MTAAWSVDVDADVEIKVKVEVEVEVTVSRLSSSELRVSSLSFACAQLSRAGGHDLFPNPSTGSAPRGSSSRVARLAAHHMHHSITFPNAVRTSCPTYFGGGVGGTHGMPRPAGAHASMHRFGRAEKACLLLVRPPPTPQSFVGRKPKSHQVECETTALPSACSAHSPAAYARIRGRLRPPADLRMLEALRKRSLKLVAMARAPLLLVWLAQCRWRSRLVLR